MVRLYDKGASMEEVLTTNGLFNLSEIHVSSKIIEEANGNFYLELTLAVTDKVSNKEIYDFIIEEAIIKIDDEYGDEIFRIAKVRKNKSTIYVYARQITIANQLSLFLKDVRPENTNGQGALNHLLAKATGRVKDTFIISDINTINTAYYMDMSLYDALFKVDNSFVKRWGGETLRRQYNCFINTKVGKDRGVVIKSKKNLVGFEINTNLDSLITRIIPKGYDTLEAEQVDSPLIDNYSSIYTKVIKYNDVKVKNENNPDEGYDNIEDAKAELIKRANNEFSEFNVDKIQAEYTLNFVDLSKTEQYKNFQIAETVNIGDIITVKEDTYNTEIKARVIKRVYSPKLKRRLETKISNIKIPYNIVSMDSIIKELNKQLENGKTPSLSNYVDNMIEAGFKDSYVLLKPNELLILDNKDITKAKNVTRYNKNGLAFSTNGYYGDYTYGFTIDGKLNASVIATGVLSTILIQNADGSVQLDLSGSNGLKFFTNGHKSIEINKQSIDFYDWEGSTRDKVVGSLFTAKRIDNDTTGDLPGTVLAHNEGTYMSISYRNPDTLKYRSYIDFDAYNLIPVKKEVKDSRDARGVSGNKPIKIHTQAEFNDYSDFNARPSMKYGVWVGEHDESNINYNPEAGRIQLVSPWGMNVFMTEGGKTQQLNKINESSTIYWNKNGERYAVISDTGFDFGDKLFTNKVGGITSRLDFHIKGNLTIEGNYPRNLREKIDNKGIDLLHELYKKELEIEDMKNRISKLEEMVNKILRK